MRPFQFYICSIISQYRLKYKLFSPLPAFPHFHGGFFVPQAVQYLFLHAQHYTGLPPRAVKPLGSVLAPNQLYEVIPLPLNVSPSDKCKNKILHSLRNFPKSFKKYGNPDFWGLRMNIYNFFSIFS